ncbi:hypothetical protein SELMODRAFT_131809 [Selaginella moellendorffii]|uniref:Leucine-rich repeat-containing N-terminal plant-type domain-containing protein n=1 Tax=Selaginella moellendorffii TaxID=88036 RepID=D8T4S1_SELML|nr:hypothetical protein SELMODRAFT_131809 [Selaginella moellendorffii]
MVFFLSLALPVESSENDDVLGLIVFKADLHDPRRALASWSEDSASPRNWTGIQCSPQSGTVTQVTLDGLELSGPLGRGLLKLDHLQSLEALGASENRLSGSIPAGVGSLSRLSSLDLSHNSLSGEIPPELGQCQMLVSLDLSYNLLSGEIPSFLESLSRLEVLRLPGNSFSGGVPEWIVRSSRSSTSRRTISG